MIGRWCVGALLVSALSGSAADAQDVASHENQGDTRAAEQLLQRHVTVDVRNVTRKQAVDTVARIANALLQYRMSIFDPYPALINLQVTDVPLGIALERLLSGTMLRVVPDLRGHISIVTNRADADSLADVGVVAGVVSDSMGKPLGQASVRMNGTPIRTMTDSAGRFTFKNVPVGDHVLLVKAIGYRVISQPVHVRRDGSETVRIRLSVLPTVLSGVITTATGRQQKVEFGSDVTRINVDSVMANAPVSSVTDLLEARVPGLTVVHTSGQPGDPSRLRLRGAGTINGSNAPIVIVDNVRIYSPDGSTNDAGKSPSTGIRRDERTYARPSSLDQIDPNTIDNIEVFKGPSASAMYGSDAANGVIVITTKKGQSGKTRWSMAFEQGTSTIPGHYPVNSYRFAHDDYASDQTPNLACVRYNPVCVTDSVVTFQALNNPQLTPLGRGWNSGASATVSGGSNALTYSVTGSGARSQGLLELPKFAERQYETYTSSPMPGWMRRPDLYTSWSGSAQVTAQLNSTTTATVSTTMTSSNQRRSSLGLGAIGSLIHGYFDTTATNNCTDQFICSPWTALGGQFLVKVIAKTRATTTAGALNWNAWSRLPITIDGGVSTNDNADRIYLPSGLPTTVSSDTNGDFQQSRGEASSVTGNARTIVPLSLARYGRVDLALGTNYVRQQFDVVSVGTSTLPVGVETPITFIPAVSTSAYSGSSSSTLGWYLEPQLKLPGRLYITPGIRFDNNGASGSQAGHMILPKINASYLVWGDDREAPSPIATLVSQLRLRGAIGVAGVQPSPEQRLRLFTAPSNVSVDGGTSVVPAVNISTFGNTHLRAERATELEGGFDTDLLDRRMSVTLTGFRKSRRDAILQVPVAPSAGSSNGGTLGGNTYLNIGSVLNTGIEGTASVRVIDRRALQWGVDVMASHVNNVLKSLAPGVAPLLTPNGQETGLLVPGYPLFSVWGAPITGYGDKNGDGIIERDEVHLSDKLFYIGSQDPNYQATIGTNLGLFNNRLSVATSVNYQNGLTQSYSNALAALRSAANATNATLFDQAVFMVTDLASANAGTHYYTYQRVNVLRWQTVSVNYRVPDMFARRVRSQAIMVALQGSNLTFHTNYRGKDPNVNANSSGNVVQDSGQLPEPRMWQLRVSITQ